MSRIHPVANAESVLALQQQAQPILARILSLGIINRNDTTLLIQIDHLFRNYFAKNATELFSNITEHELRFYFNNVFRGYLDLVYQRPAENPHVEASKLWYTFCSYYSENINRTEQAREAIERCRPLIGDMTEMAITRLTTSEMLTDEHIAIFFTILLLIVVTIVIFTLKFRHIERPVVENRRPSPYEARPTADVNANPTAFVLGDSASGRRRRERAIFDPSDPSTFGGRRTKRRKQKFSSFRSRTKHLR